MIFGTNLSLIGLEKSLPPLMEQPEPTRLSNDNLAYQIIAAQHSLKCNLSYTNTLGYIRILIGIGYPEKKERLLHS